MSMSAQVETYFDPDDGLENRVAEEIGRARKSIWIQAYKFSSETITDTIQRLKRDNPGLDVRLSLDAKEALASRDKKQGRIVAKIAEVGLDQRIARFGECCGDIASLARRAIVVVEVVEADDLVAAREQRIAQVAADKARASGYQVPHCCAPILDRVRMCRFIMYPSESGRPVVLWQQRQQCPHAR